VVGYVGGLDTPNNPYSGIIQIRNRLRGLKYEGLCVDTFSAYTWLDGYSWLMKQLAASGEIASAAKEGAGPKIIIYGHSLGGWATLATSRKLAIKNIPVELTVQVDSVGLTDAVVPANVKQAANYFRHAYVPPYGRTKISAQDPGATQILGNFRIERANHVSVAMAPAISDLIVAKVKALYDAPE
jgi:pimeloyl-ACP methyl ester carboxylesterase